LVTAFHQREMSKESGVVLPRKVLACLLVCGVVGCMDARVTTPARSATEQLLLTTAADLAAEKLRLEKLSGKRVALKTTRLDGYAGEYVACAVSDVANRQGALLASDPEHAEVVVTVRTGALSVDRSDFLLGVPTFQVPLPFGGSVQTPELPLLKKIKLTGIAKLAAHAYEPKSGKVIMAGQSASGLSYYSLWTVLGVTFRATNVPEKKPRFAWWPWGT